MKQYWSFGQSAPTSAKPTRTTSTSLLQTSMPTSYSSAIFSTQHQKHTTKQKTFPLLPPTLYATSLHAASNPFPTDEAAAAPPNSEAAISRFFPKPPTAHSSISRQQARRPTSFGAPATSTAIATSSQPAGHHHVLISPSMYAQTHMQRSLDVDTGKDKEEDAELYPRLLPQGSSMMSTSSRQETVMMGVGQDRDRIASYKADENSGGGAGTMTATGTLMMDSSTLTGALAARLKAQLSASESSSLLSYHYTDTLLVIRESVTGAVVQSFHISNLCPKHWERRFFSLAAAVIVGDVPMLLVCVGYDEPEDDIACEVFLLEATSTQWVPLPFEFETSLVAMDVCALNETASQFIIVFATFDAVSIAYFAFSNENGPEFGKEMVAFSIEEESRVTSVHCYCPWMVEDSTLVIVTGHRNGSVLVYEAGDRDNMLQFKLRGKSALIHAVDKRPLENVTVMRLESMTVYKDDGVSQAILAVGQGSSPFSNTHKFPTSVTLIQISSYTSDTPLALGAIQRIDFSGHIPGLLHALSLVSFSEENFCCDLMVAHRRTSEMQTCVIESFHIQLLAQENVVNVTPMPQKSLALSDVMDIAGVCSHREAKYAVLLSERAIVSLMDPPTESARTVDASYEDWFDEPFPYVDNFIRRIHRRRQETGPLFIDMLFELAGMSAKLYPPRQQSDVLEVMDALKASTISANLKHCLVYYLLKDFNDSRDQQFVEHLELPIQFDHLTCAYWLLDQGKYQDALTYLTDPMVTPNWTNVILRLYYKNNMFSEFRTLHTIFKVGIENPEDIEMFVHVYAKEDIEEALKIKRIHGYGQDEQLLHRIFSTFFLGDDASLKMIDTLLKTVTLNPDEEIYMLNFCKSSHSSVCKQFALVYLIHHHRILEAIQYHQQLLVTHPDVLNARLNSLVEQCKRMLPSIQQKHIAESGRPLFQEDVLFRDGLINSDCLTSDMMSLTLKNVLGKSSKTRGHIQPRPQLILSSTSKKSSGSKLPAPPRREHPQPTYRRNLHPSRENISVQDTLLPQKREPFSIQVEDFDYASLGYSAENEDQNSPGGDEISVEEAEADLEHRVLYPDLLAPDYSHHEPRSLASMVRGESECAREASSAPFMGETIPLFESAKASLDANVHLGSDSESVSQMSVLGGEDADASEKMNAPEPMVSLYPKLSSLETQDTERKLVQDMAAGSQSRLYPALPEMPEAVSTLQPESETISDVVTTTLPDSQEQPKTFFSLEAPGNLQDGAVDISTVGHEEQDDFLPASEFEDSVSLVTENSVAIYPKQSSLSGHQEELYVNDLSAQGVSAELETGTSEASSKDVDALMSKHAVEYNSEQGTAEDNLLHDIPHEKNQSSHEITFVEEASAKIAPDHDEPSDEEYVDAATLSVPHSPQMYTARSSPRFTKRKRNVVGKEAKDASPPKLLKLATVNAAEQIAAVQRESSPTPAAESTSESGVDLDPPMTPRRSSRNMTFSFSQSSSVSSSRKTSPTPSASEDAIVSQRSGFSTPTRKKRAPLSDIHDLTPTVVKQRSARNLHLALEDSSDAPNSFSLMSPSVSTSQVGNSRSKRPSARHESSKSEEENEELTNIQSTSDEGLGVSMTASVTNMTRPKLERGEGEGAANFKSRRRHLEDAHSNDDDSSSTNQVERDGASSSPTESQQEPEPEPEPRYFLRAQSPRLARAQSEEPKTPRARRKPAERRIHDITDISQDAPTPRATRRRQHLRVDEILKEELVMPTSDISDAESEDADTVSIVNHDTTEVAPVEPVASSTKKPRKTRSTAGRKSTRKSMATPAAVEIAIAVPSASSADPMDRNEDDDDTATAPLRASSLPPRTPVHRKNAPPAHEQEEHYRIMTRSAAKRK